MEVVILLVLVSLVLVAAGLVLLLVRVHEGDLEHGERLSLLPLEPDEGPEETEPNRTALGRNP